MTDIQESDRPEPDWSSVSAYGFLTRLKAGEYQGVLTESGHRSFLAAIAVAEAHPDAEARKTLLRALNTGVNSSAQHNGYYARNNELYTLLKGARPEAAALLEFAAIVRSGIKSMHEKYRRAYDNAKGDKSGQALGHFDWFAHEMHVTTSTLSSSLNKLVQAFAVADEPAPPAGRAADSSAD